MAPKRWIDEIVAAAMGLDEHPQVTFGQRKYLTPSSAIYHGSTPYKEYESMPKTDIFPEYSSKFLPEYTNMPFDEALAASYAGGMEFPYDPTKYGYIKNPDTRPAPVNEPRTWTDTQTIALRPSLVKPKNAFDWLNSTVNAHINRNARSAINSAERFGLITTEAANNARHQIRNAQYQDYRSLPGKTGKAKLTFESPYRDAKTRQRQAYEAMNYFPEESDAYKGAAEDFLYQGKIAQHYNPINPYTQKYRPAIKGVLLAAPIVYGMTKKRMTNPKKNNKSTKKNTNKYY